MHNLHQSLARWSRYLLLLTVPEEGSRHRAAKRLHISQPALSREMQALEHELGGRLLEHIAAAVSPTAAARHLPKGWALCSRPMIWL